MLYHHLPILFFEIGSQFEKIIGCLITYECFENGNLNYKLHCHISPYPLRAYKQYNFKDFFHNLV